MWLIRLFWDITWQEIRQNIIQHVSPPLLSRPHYLEWPLTTAYGLDLTLISSCKYLLCLGKWLRVAVGGMWGVSEVRRCWVVFASLWWWFDLSPPPPVSHRLMKQTVFTKHMQLHHLHAVRGKCIALLSDDAVRRGHRHLRCLGKAALFTDRCNITFDIKNKICVYTLGQLKYSRCSCFEFTCL